MSGVGLGAAIVSQVAQTPIANLGWRLAYLALGGLVLVCGFLAAFLLMREPKKPLTEIYRSKA